MTPDHGSLPILFAITNSGWAFVVIFLSTLVIALLAIFRRNTERIQDLQARLALYEERRRLAFENLQPLGDAFHSGTKMEAMMHAIVRFAIRTTVASAGALFLPEGAEGRLTRRLTIGSFPALSAPPREPETFAAGEGFIGQTAALGRCMLVRDAINDERFPKPAAGEPIRSLLTVPLKFRNRLLGVIAVINKQPDHELAPPFFTEFDYFLLDALAAQIAMSLYLAEAFEVQAAQQRLDADLRLASEAQALLLPKVTPTISGFEIAGANQPALRVGGDYFDYLALDAQRVGVAIADASGKGAAGALVMAMCRSVMRSQMLQHTAPAQALTEFNRQVSPDLREDTFVTVLYGILDGPKRTFRFARAGHDPLLWVHADTGAVDVLAPKGVAIGLDREGKLDNARAEQEIAVATGDLLVLYTDGLTEAVGPAGEEFGRDRLIALLQAKRGATALEISAAVFGGVKQFTQDAPLADDQTLVVIKAV